MVNKVSFLGLGIPWCKYALLPLAHVHVPPWGILSIAWATGHYIMFGNVKKAVLEVITCAYLYSFQPVLQHHGHWNQVHMDH